MAKENIFYITTEKRNYNSVLIVGMSKVSLKRKFDSIRRLWKDFSRVRGVYHFNRKKVKWVGMPQMIDYLNG